MRRTLGKIWLFIMQKWLIIPIIVAIIVGAALLGFFVGLYAFMAYIMSSARFSPTPGTLLMALASAALVLWFNTLYWPQMVLFRQSAVNRLRNALLFTIKRSVKVLLAVVIQLFWIAIIVLLAPWTLVAVPFLGFWVPILLAQLCLYGDLNRDLGIEARFIPVEGDPWAKDAFESLPEEEPAEPDPMNSGARHWESLLRDIERNKEDK